MPQGIIRDDFDALYAHARSVIDPGGRAGDLGWLVRQRRDMTSDVIARLGQPGVLVHGVSIKPGKPTILAVCDGKAVIGLPGNPVSALVVAICYHADVVELQGRTTPAPTPWQPG